MTILSSLADSILRAALAEELFLVVRVHSGPDVVTPALRARQILYRFRNEFPDPAFRELQIRLSPQNPDTELWVGRFKTPDAIEPVPQQEFMTPSGAAVVDVEDI